MPFSPDITAKLLELKQISGMTYEQIGTECRTSDTNVRRYINGEVKTPDRKLLFSIVRSIGGDPDELFAPKPTPNNPAPAGLDYALYDRVVANMEARYQQQERLHEETLRKWHERHDREIATLQNASDQAIRSKDEWISRIRAEMVSMEQDLKRHRKVQNSLLTISLVLALIVLLFILIYLVPDILRSDWGHIKYS